MFRRIPILALLLFNFAAFSQYDNWEEISENIPENLPEGHFTDISCVEGETWIILFVPGQLDGIILHSDDGCLSFTVQELQSVPMAIHMVSTDIGFIGCKNGDIYFTSNGGEMWKKIPANFDKQINGIKGLLNPLVGYACGEERWIVKFDTNYIISQEKLFDPWWPVWWPNFDLYDIEFPTDTTEGWVCGSEGTIGHYSNNEWDSLNPPYSDTYYGIDILNGTQKGWCVGGQGFSMTPVIVHTEDGINWHKQYHPLIDQWLYDVYFINQNIGWAVGMYILETTNGGMDWFKQAESFGNIWNAVHANISSVFVVGNHKRMLKKILSVAIEEKGSGLSFSVVPNPFTTSTTLSYSLDKSSAVTINIYNTHGQLIEKIEHEQPKGDQNVRWHAESLPAGMYYFRIQAGDKVGGGKMVKME